MLGEMSNKDKYIKCISILGDKRGDLLLEMMNVYGKYSLSSITEYEALSFLRKITNT